MEKTVYFRAFEEEDAELIYQWMNDDELKKMSIGLNRRMCKEEALDEHESTVLMRSVMFSTTEGVMRQASFKNGRYYDVSISSLLCDEYFMHKNAGDYEISAVLRRMRKAIKDRKR